MCLFTSRKAKASSGHSHSRFSKFPFFYQKGAPETFSKYCFPKETVAPDCLLKLQKVLRLPSSLGQSLPPFVPKTKELENSESSLQFVEGMIHFLRKYTVRVWWVNIFNLGNKTSLVWKVVPLHELNLYPIKSVSVRGDSNVYVCINSTTHKELMSHKAARSSLIRHQSCQSDSSLLIFRVLQKTQNALL